MSVVFNVLQRQSINQSTNAQESLENALYGLSMEKDSLAAANDSIQAILDRYMFLADSLETLVEGNQKQIKYLNSKLKEAVEEIDNLNPTEIYDAIVQEIDAVSSMVEGEEKYVFNEYQTRDIYKRIVRVNYLDSIVIQQREMVERLHGQIINKDDIIATLKEDNEAKLRLLNRLYADLANSTKQLDMSEADNRRLQKTLRLWQIGSIGAGAALVLILILL